MGDHGRLLQNLSELVVPHNVSGSNVQIDWARVVDFIGQRDTALAASFVGVDLRRIHEVETGLGIRLPSAYVDFLTTMGEDSGPLRPFGETRIHAFSRLLAELPPKGYPARRFFKVAVETDELADAWFNTYLDLARSDGNDAALVMFESPLDPRQSDVREQPLSFVEKVVEHIFLSVEVAPKNYGARIFVHGEEPWRGVEIMQQVVQSLIEDGFAAVLPESQRVACLSRGPVSILVTDSDTSELVDLRIGGDDLEATELVVAPLIAAIPGASLYQPAARQEAESEI